jgi:mRNA interferase YafQ
LKQIKSTHRFLRDLKLARRRGKHIAKLEALIEALARGIRLAPKHRRHRLRGEMQGIWECHIEPDWLLLWDETDEAIILIRTGTHADLFD